MKSIPQPTDLIKAYNQLQQSSNEVLDLKDLMQYCEWSRFDPRLFEILAVYFFNSWKSISAVLLYYEVKKSSTPQTLAAILEHTKILLEKDSVLYSNWMATVLSEIQPVPFQSYFIGLKPFAAASVRRASLAPCIPFENWGFAEDEILIHGIVNYPSGAFSKSARKNILEFLCKKKKKFQIQDYVFACRGSISIRQAQRDIKDFKLTRSVGNTKARVYISKYLYITA